MMSMSMYADYRVHLALMYYILELRARSIRDYDKCLFMDPIVQIQTECFQSASVSWTQLFKSRPSVFNPLRFHGPNCLHLDLVFSIRFGFMDPIVQI
jgi:hypothetical protein